MKDNNTTLVKTTSKLSTLLRPLHVTVNPEFAEAAKETAAQTKAAAIVAKDTTVAGTKLGARKISASITAAWKALKETK